MGLNPFAMEGLKFGVFWFWLGDVVIFFPMIVARMYLVTLYLFLYLFFEDLMTS